MSARVLWVLSIPLALLAWASLGALTYAVPPDVPALAAALVFLAFAVTLTAAPFVWFVASRAKLPGAGQRPILSLRIALWAGLWAAGCVALQALGLLSWPLAVTYGVVLGLLEAFLQQRAASH